MTGLPSKKGLIIASAVIVILALAGLLIGGYLAGWDILGWFSTPMAIYLYIGLGLFAILIVGLLVRDWSRK